MQIRADLYDYLENIGFEPVLSEYPSFPVDPDYETISNCRKAVEERADILLLIIGGRYGSINEHGKSITNLEYVTARAKGIPVYVFVMRKIIDLLAIWTDNPQGDFKSVVDSTALLEFVSSVRNVDKTWVFPFDLAQDIVKALRLQMAYLFSDALTLRSRITASGVALDKYKHASPEELRLLIDRPSAWEYSLFAKALRREVSQCEPLKRDWSNHIAFGPKKYYNRAQFALYLSEKLAQAKSLETNFKAILPSTLIDAVGAPDQAGDPDKIFWVANRIAAQYREALQWKIDFYTVLVPEIALRIRDAVSSVLDKIVPQIEDFSMSLQAQVDDAISASKFGKVSREITLYLTFNTELPDLERHVSELGDLDW